MTGNGNHSPTVIIKLCYAYRFLMHVWFVTNCETLLKVELNKYGFYYCKFITTATWCYTLKRIR